MKKYIAKDTKEVYEAVQFDGWNYPKVSDWAYGKHFMYPQWIHQYESVDVPGVDREIRAHIGDWIIKKDGKCSIYSEEEFLQEFEELE